MIGLDHITSNSANVMFVAWTERTTSFPGSGDIRGLNTIWP